MVLALAVGWAKVMEFDTEVYIGKKLSATKKKWVLAFLASAAIYYTGSALVISALGLSLSLMLLHAACHKLPETLPF